MYEYDRGSLKDVNVSSKFKQETHEKREESGAIILLNRK